MVKKSTTWSVLLYGVLVLGLGLYGYKSAGSEISLYVGGGLGCLLILSSLVMFGGYQWGAYLALGLTIALTATFAFRYSITNSGLPAVMSVISGGMLLFLMAQTARWKK